LHQQRNLTLEVSLTINSNSIVEVVSKEVLHYKGAIEFESLLFIFL